MDASNADALRDELRAIQEPMLTQRLYRIIWSRVAGIDDAEYRSVLPTHLRWQLAREAEGVLFASGPLTAEDGTRLEQGMSVVRAESFADVHELAESEPFVARGYRTYDLCAWDVNEGAITVRVSIGSGRAAWT